MKYTNHFKRFFALLLCVCMVLGMAPAVTMAAEDTATVTLYCNNTAGWTTVNAYYWGHSSNSFVPWPGTAMTDLGGGIWSIEVPADATYVIFNNGSDLTGDLPIPTDGSNCYDLSSDAWSVHTPDGSDGGDDNTGGDNTGGDNTGGEPVGAVTLYFNNTANWSTVNIYYWSGNTGMTTWPGVAMSDLGDGIWAFDVPAGATYVIFNNSSAKTHDLPIPTDGSNCYDFSSGAWSVYTPGGGDSGGEGCDHSLENYAVHPYINCMHTGTCACGATSATEPHTDADADNVCDGCGMALVAKAYQFFSIYSFGSLPGDSTEGMREGAAVGTRYYTDMTAALNSEFLALTVLADATVPANDLFLSIYATGDGFVDPDADTTGIVPDTVVIDLNGHTLTLERKVEIVADVTEAIEHYLIENGTLIVDHLLLICHPISLTNHATIKLGENGRIENGSFFGSCMEDDSNHVWKDSACLICRKTCSHSYGEDGVCTTCGATEHTYAVVGAIAPGHVDAGILGTAWDIANTANDMVYDAATGLYSITYTNVPATGETVDYDDTWYEYKVVQDHTWDVSYNENGANEDGMNARFDVERDGSTVVIYFDGTKVWAEVTPPSGGEEEEVLTGYAVDIGGTVTYYTDFREAINAACAAEAARLKLYQDVEGGFYDLNSGNVTLNLNGKTINGRLEIEKCTLTITDTAENKGTIVNYAGCAIDYSSGKLIILDTVDCTGEAEGHYAWRISRIDATEADAGTIGTTGTEDIVIPEDTLVLHNNTAVTILPASGQVVDLHRHTWTDATCTAPKTCTDCGATEGEVKHEWTDATCTAPKTCTLCGATEGEADPGKHEWTDATCTAPKTCTVCSTTEGEALGHDYGEDGICSVCGKYKNSIIISMTDRYGDGWNANAIEVYEGSELLDVVTFDNGESYIWNCPYDDTKIYTFYWVKGSYSEECSFEIQIREEAVFTAAQSDCTDFIDGQVIYSTCDHIPGEGVVTPPTCTEDGYTTYTCTLCGLTYQDDFVDGGHSFGEDNICTVCGYSKYIVIFFRNDLQWTDVRVHYWGSEIEEDTQDSGLPMEFYFNNGTYDFYAAKIPGDIDGLSFSGMKDGESQPSPDNYYEWGNGAAFYVNGDTLWHGHFADIADCDHKYNTNKNDDDCNTALVCSICFDTLVKAGHNFGDDGICTNCGADENKLILISMTDDYGDGWSGNAIEVYENGVQVGTATLSNGSSGVWSGAYDPEKEYEFYWVQGDYPEDCVFKISFAGEVMFTATMSDCGGYPDGYRVYPVCEHDFEKGEVTPPTCTDEGYTTYSCTICGLSKYDDYVDAPGHTKGEQEGVVTEPTCTEFGYTTYTCAVCNETYNDDYVDPLGHTTGEGVVTEPTCDAEGYTTYSCTVCGESIVEDYVAALGHTLGENGNCTVCGELFSVPVWVAGEQITAQNMEDVLGDGTVSYDLDTNTLTLNGFSYDGENVGINSKIPLNIVITGENKIISANNGFYFDIVSGEINISGTGSLIIEASGEGIHVNATYDVDMTISGSVSIDMVIDNSEGIYLEGPTANLLIKDSVKLTIGTEAVPNGEECLYVAADNSGSLTISGNAQVSVVTDDEEGFYVGGDEQSITITGGDIYVNADEEGLDANTITISGGVVEAYGGVGYEGIYADDLTITGGTITVGGNDQAIEADNITITGGTVTVTEGGMIAVVNETEVGTTGTITLTGVEIAEPEGATIGTMEMEDEGTVTAVLNADGSYADAFTISPVEVEVKNGIVAEDGSLYYYENGVRVYAGLKEIDGSFYYVRSNGEVVNNRTYWITSTNGLMEQGAYEFDADGKMIIPEPDPVKDGIYYENGAWYYYENGTIGYNKGLMTVTENWVNGDAVQSKTGIIYVRSNGKLATGNYYITNVSNYTGSDWKSGDKMVFDDNGLLIVRKNGIVAENGSLYYYVDDQKQYSAGVIQLDGNYYYVRSDAEVVNNRSYWISNVGNSGVIAKQYTFDADGVMQNPEFVAEVKDGIVDGYYYKNGKIAYGAGVVYLEDEGCYIYVRSNGQLATGNYWPTSTNGLLDAKCYNWGTDGKLFLD